VVGAWFPAATETDEPAFDPVPPAGDRDPDAAGEDEPAEGDSDTPAPARPKDLADLATFTDTLADGSPCGFCPEMVVIPAGTFTMGSPPEEAGRYDDEGPQREVRVERFALGRSEVTFAQYNACVDAGGCAERPDDEGSGRGALPVINVSWDDAQAYVDWLADATGQPYRLPSEAEWEYAARAGTTTRFTFGDEISSSQANFGTNVGRPWEVGSGAANDWRLFDMHGNVWEWVEDCVHGSYEGAPRDGSAWLQSDDGDCSRRVVRGGSWIDYPGYLRSADRDGDVRDDRGSDLGFRVARTLTP
jgi:formylglycine-generating enzyme required for sulfatase activity